jgi:hypothetical protein
MISIMCVDGFILHHFCDFLTAIHTEVLMRVREEGYMKEGERGGGPQASKSYEVAYVVQPLWLTLELSNVVTRLYSPLVARHYVIFFPSNFLQSTYHFFNVEA